MNAAPVISGILEAAVYADDLDAAAGFYGGALGLIEIGRTDGRHVFYRCGATILLVFRAAVTKLPHSGTSLPVPAHGATGRGHVCFAVNGADMDATRARLEAAGIGIEADFLWGPGGARSVYVRDPAGNSVEFAEPRLWEKSA